MLNRFHLLRISCFLGLLLSSGFSLAQAEGGVTERATDFFVLCYHDVRDDMRNATPGVLTISTQELINQFAWLREHNYKVISLDDLVAARDGTRPLPGKAVLLTFDDGYVSMYKRVLPLLRLFNYPAVLALVGDWMDAAPGTTVNYGDKPVPRERFLTWPQVHELIDSGLVELASHSNDLHHGVLANPQANRLPAASSRIYHTETGRYESDAQYEQRLLRDLRASVDSIHKHTGKRPRAMVWPYGAYNQPALEIARSLGMHISLTLDDGPNRVDTFETVRRNLIGNGSSLSDIIPALHHQEARRPERVVHIDLDYVYDANPVQQERNLGQLVERIHRLKVSTVYLQAFADPDGDGAADALYFQNRHLPMRADLFGRAAWQLRTRAGVQVYAWMPVLAYHFPKSHPLAGATVKSAASAPYAVTTQVYHRLSPFDPEAMRVVGEIYEDLARYTDFAGLLFHDDAVLDDFEDASGHALHYYTQNWGLPADINQIRANHELAERWAKAKTAFLIDTTHRLADRVRRYRPSIKTARNIYARVVQKPEAEQWFAQSYLQFLRAYDYTVVMAMPGLENIGRNETIAWLRALADKVIATPGGLNKTIFELQAKDWRNDKFIDAGVLARQIHVINSAGLFNFGYYPDDFLNDQPNLQEIRPFISLETFPYERAQQ